MYCFSTLFLFPHPWGPFPAPALCRQLRFLFSPLCSFFRSFQPPFQPRTAVFQSQLLRCCALESFCFLVYPFRICFQACFFPLCSWSEKITIWFVSWVTSVARASHYDPPRRRVVFWSLLPVGVLFPWYAFLPSPGGRTYLFFAHNSFFPAVICPVKETPSTLCHREPKQKCPLFRSDVRTHPLPLPRARLFYIVSGARDPSSGRRGSLLRFFWITPLVPPYRDHLHARSRPLGRSPTPPTIPVSDLHSFFREVPVDRSIYFFFSIMPFVFFFIRSLIWTPSLLNIYRPALVAVCPSPFPFPVFTIQSCSRFPTDFFLPIRRQLSNPPPSFSLLGVIAKWV